jgi:hypothetical protein
MRLAVLVVVASSCGLPGGGGRRQAGRMAALPGPHPATQVAAPSIAGSAWTGVGPACELIELRFRAGGALERQTWSRGVELGTWRQTGAYVAADLRQTAIEAVVDGERMEGTFTGDAGIPAGFRVARAGSDAAFEPGGLWCSTWRGVVSFDDIDAPIVIRFRTDGVVHLHDLYGYNDAGTFVVRGDALELRMRDFVYSGFLSGDVLAGDLTTPGGERVAFRAIRDLPLRAPPAALRGGFTGRWVDGDLSFELELDEGVLRLGDGDERAATIELDGALVHVVAEGVELWGGLVDGQLHGTGVDGGTPFSWAAWPRAGDPPPEPPPVAAAADPFTGTVWEGELDGRAVVRFEADGVLAVERGKQEAVRGTWSATGKILAFTLAGVTWQAELRDDALTGFGWNDAGTRWALELVRRP